MAYSKLRNKLHSEDADNNWAVSYGDMITLLLAFFVIFFNIKSESMSLKLIKTEIDSVFKPLPSKRNLASPNVDNKRQTLPVISADIQNLAKLQTNLMGERLLIEFPGVSFFKSGSEALTREGKSVLSDFTKILAAHKGLFRMVVRGYTDGTPLKGSGRYRDNLELSAFRSLSAIRHLHTEGLPLSMMRIAGYGESASGLDRKAAQKRRVVLVLEPLDHTERQDYQESKTSSQRPLEDVQSISVPPGEAKIIENKWMEFGRHAVFLIDQNIQVQWRRASKKIETNSFYQKLLKRQLVQDLQLKGHSQAQSINMAEDYLKPKGVWQ